MRVLLCQWKARRWPKRFHQVSLKHRKECQPPYDWHFLLCPSYFKLQRCYLHSLTPVTYLSKRQGMSELGA